MTKKTALDLFREFILPDIPSDDITAKCESWNNFVDRLCKDGEITEAQSETWSNPF